ncbi:MAG: hypothetical protein ACEQR8_12190, partial [Cypionkella sp.]
LGHLGLDDQVQTFARGRKLGVTGERFGNLSVPIAIFIGKKRIVRINLPCLPPECDPKGGSLALSTRALNAPRSGDRLTR